MIRSFGSHVRRNLIAYAALFFALGGTSFAAVQALPRNSVGSPQIKNRSIQRIDISRRAAASLRGLRGPRGFTGAQGTQGIQGVKGDKGDKGDQGDVGPTYGAVGAASGIPTPAYPPTTVISTQNINLPRAGALFVTGRLEGSVGCSSGGSCQVDYALYLDNVLVPNTGTTIDAPASGSDTDHLTMFGVVPNVSAGAHQLKLGGTGVGSWSFFGYTDRATGAILLGGSAAAASTSSNSANVRTTNPIQ